MKDRQDEASDVGPQLAIVESPAAKEAAAWAQHFSRTLKTCRLYDGDNAAVVRFRTELSVGLVRFLAAYHALTLTFTSTEVLCEAGTGPAAPLRDEGLALTFYRDGVRSLTLNHGIEPKEVDALLDLVLHVSSHKAEDEDLVTLIWDAGLPHVDLKYVSVDGDLEGGGDAEEWDGEPGAVAPWPASEGAALGAAVPAAPNSGSDSRHDEPGVARSDDWLTATTVGHPETAFEELEKRYPQETARFRSEYLTEYKRTLVRTSLDLMRDCLEAASEQGDTQDLRRFLLRPLHEALGAGQWGEASEALELIRGRGDASDLMEDFVGGLCEANSLTSRGVVAELDARGAQGIEPFLAFARALGPLAVEWLMHLLAASEKRQVRLALTATVADLCLGKPERLVPWLTDSRWYVVRNVIHILGRIGGPGIVGLLRDASEHEEYRVRREVATAASTAGAEEARPLLLGMLNTMDSRFFCAALRQLSTGRDPELARLLVAQLQDSGFRERPVEERHAVYAAIAAVGDDEVVPALEAELNTGSRFQRTPDAHHRAVARCLVHLDTPRARAVYTDGLRSRKPAVRKACEEALGGCEA